VVKCSKEVARLRVELLVAGCSGCLAVVKGFEPINCSVPGESTKVD